jgi:hypothetical protein
MSVANVFKGVLLSLKKRKSLTICRNMDGIWEHYAIWNKADTEKYCMISLIHGIF